MDELHETLEDDMRKIKEEIHNLIMGDIDGEWVNTKDFYPILASMLEYIQVIKNELERRQGHELLRQELAKSTLTMEKLIKAKQILDDNDDHPFNDKPGGWR